MIFRYLNLSDQRNYLLSDLFTANLVNNNASDADDSYVEFDESEMSKIDVPLIYDSFESDKNRGKHDGEKLLKVLLSLYAARQK